MVSFYLFRVIGYSENIINGNMIKCGKLYKNIRRDIPLSKLIVAVDLLRTVQKIGQLPLLHIPILTQIP